MKQLNIGIIREGKVPADSRVPLTPKQCRMLMDKFPNVKILVQRSEVRCIKDEEYRNEKVEVVEDISVCDILMGVKEVPIDQLIPSKHYFFFSHTIKEQPYNRGLLQAMLKNNIRMTDYETLRNEEGNRIIGFGRYAGIVGAHNGIRAYGLKTKSFELDKAHECKDFEAIKEQYKQTKFPPFKVVNTGIGKVANGALETLEALGFKRVSGEEFITKEFDQPVYVHLKYKDMYKHKETGLYDQNDFYKNSQNYICDFVGYTKNADVFINGIYWEKGGPVYFTKEQMKEDSFRIKVIADITCDIAPDSSVPSTLRAAKIGDDVFGYDPHTETEVAPFLENTVDMMTVDNLPNELPRDASNDFGKMLIGNVIEELMKDQSDIIEQATIANGGALTEFYAYLQNYVDGV